MPLHSSFILRVWRARQGRRWACRAMLERVSTGERVGFPDLPSLVTFLQADVEAKAEVQAETQDAPAHKITVTPDELEVGKDT